MRVSMDAQDTLGTVPEKITLMNSYQLSPAMPTVCGYVGVYFGEFGYQGGCG